MAVLITSSEMKTFQRCKRQWWLREFRGLRKPEGGSSPINIGNLVHIGLDEIYNPAKGGSPVAALVRARDHYLDDADPEDISRLFKDAETAGIMIEGYLEWLEETGADDGLEVYAAEETVSQPLGDTGFTLLGKLDMRARRRDGSRVFLDHKTVMNMTDTPRMAQLNPQFLTYHLLEFLQAKERGDGSERLLDGMVINMLRRVKRGKTAKPPFYARHEVRYNREEIRNHWKHVVAIARDMDHVRRRLLAGDDHQVVAPPTPQKSCTWDCPFFAVCPMFDDGSDAEGMLAAQFKVSDPFERYNKKEDNGTSTDIERPDPGSLWPR